MLKGSLEVIEFEPRQAVADAPVLSVESEDLWSRLRLEHRTLTSFAAAIAVSVVHFLLVAPVLWTGGTSRDSQERYRGDAALQVVVFNDSGSTAATRPPALPSPALEAIVAANAFPAITPIAQPASGSDRSDQTDGQTGLGAMYGRYVGQMRARIERAWRRQPLAVGCPSRS